MSGHNLQTGSEAFEKPEAWAGWWGEEWQLLQGVPIHVGSLKVGVKGSIGGKEWRRVAITAQLCVRS